jgi:hypothetical protein
MEFEIWSSRADDGGTYLQPPPNINGWEATQMQGDSGAGQDSIQREKSRRDVVDTETQQRREDE